MNNLIKFSCLALFAMVFFSNCVVDPEEEMETIISDDPVTGSLDVGEDFVMESAFVEGKNWFGEDGYYFKLFSTDEDCINGSTPNLSREIDFFVESESTLSEGAYDGNGPYIGTSSFFGCSVIITSVSETSISGKVKGGNPPDKWVEGSFTAIFCN